MQAQADGQDGQAKAPEKRCYRCGSTDAAGYLPLYTFGLLICAGCYRDALWYDRAA
jgi:hypothetical protein